MSGTNGPASFDEAMRDGAFALGRRPITFEWALGEYRAYLAKEEKK